VRGELGDGDALQAVRQGRLPGRSECPREHSTLPRTNPPGGNKGFGFFGGIKSLKRRCMADEVMQESARAKRGEGNSAPTAKGEVKAL
jgi:hypothetical protein